MRKPASIADVLCCAPLLPHKFPSQCQSPVLCCFHSSGSIIQFAPLLFGFRFLGRRRRRNFRTPEWLHFIVSRFKLFRRIIHLVHSFDPVYLITSLSRLDRALPWRSSLAFSTQRKVFDAGHHPLTISSHSFPSFDELGLNLRRICTLWYNFWTNLNRDRRLKSSSLSSDSHFWLDSSSIPFCLQLWQQVNYSSRFFVRSKTVTTSYFCCVCHHASLNLAHRFTFRRPMQRLPRSRSGMRRRKCSFHRRKLVLSAGKGNHLSQLSGFRRLWQGRRHGYDNRSVSSRASWI